MISKLLLSLLLLCTLHSIAAFANPSKTSEPNRKPADTSPIVTKVKGSELEVAEKWVDVDNGIVCYVTMHTGSGGTAISCVRVTNPK
jgi:hypothetical protein